jgi:O-antigen ligase
MGNIYTYFKNAWLNLQKETKDYPVFLGILLALWAIPLSYAINNVALGILLLLAIRFSKKQAFVANPALYFPMALFALMAFSFIWTADTAGTLRALSKGLTFVLLPLVFLFYPVKNALPKILKGYAYGVLVYSVFCLGKAVFRYYLTSDSTVFFYHELVTEDVNAIHVSVYVALALFIFLKDFTSSKIVWLYLAVLAAFLVLLSSKNILVIAFGLAVIHLFIEVKGRMKAASLWLGIAGIALVLGLFSSKILDRFQIELESNITEKSINTELSAPGQNVYNVSVDQAWNQAVFSANDYFPGTAFRVYQIRIFLELLQADPILFTGYGLNATDAKIAQKQVEHQLYADYGHKNFHNEYIQLFAELGIFGLVLLLALLFINTRNAVRAKDFVHISFAVLMISLFLTESFLSRQRGIVFFSLMYCLFNSANTINASTEAKSNL